METYIHTLICVDPQYVPQPHQVVGFLEALVAVSNFQVVAPSRGESALPLVMKPTGEFRKFKCSSGEWETSSVPMMSREQPDSIACIDRFIQGAVSYRVRLAGEWSLADTPLVLYTPDKLRYEKTYWCMVSCECRPEPVSTSYWDDMIGPNVRNIPSFGSPCGPDRTSGTFPNPWTRKAIEVADAGCARFWIEFEFGDFLFPSVDGTLEVLRPAVVRQAEECFKTRFVQGCHCY